MEEAVTKKVFSPEIEKLVDNLTLMDDDLMSRVFDHNIPATQLLLRIILQENVEVVDVIGQEDMKNPLADGRSIRVDVLAKDATGRYFDCEVQRSNAGANPRRARFHSAMLDTRMLGKGLNFPDIKDSYVIFITQEDYFKRNKPVYRIKRLIDDERNFDDGNYIIYVNGSYKEDDAIGHLVQDMCRLTTEGFYYKELENGVRHFKCEEGRIVMCEAVEKYAKDQYNYGLEQGLEQGLLTTLIDLVQSGDLPIETAAKKLEISVQDFKIKMDEYLETATFT